MFYQTPLCFQTSQWPHSIWPVSILVFSNHFPKHTCLLLISHHTILRNQHHTPAKLLFFYPNKILPFTTNFYWPPSGDPIQPPHSLRPAIDKTSNTVSMKKIKFWRLESLHTKRPSTAPGMARPVVSLGLPRGRWRLCRDPPRPLAVGGNGGDALNVATA